MKQIHFVAIKVRIEGPGGRYREAKGLVRHHTNAVAHHGHLVQRRLAVEEHKVTIAHVSVHNVAILQLRGQLATIGILERLGEARFGLANILGTRPLIWARKHQALQLGDVV